MTLNRFRRSRLTAFVLILSEALGFGAWSFHTLAQSRNAAPRPALPTPMSTSTLIGLEQPPQLTVPPSKPAVPPISAPPP